MGSSQLSCRCNHLKDKPFAESSVIQVSNNNKLIIRGVLNFNKQSTFKKMQIAATQFCTSTKIGSQYIPVVMRLLAYNQSNVFDAFYTLPFSKSIQFMNNICQVNLDMMDSLFQQLVVNGNDNNRQVKRLNDIAVNYSPLEALDIRSLKVEQRLDLTQKGVSILKQSKIAILFMCSGPSSRFYFQDKFLHPLKLSNNEQEQTTILKTQLQKLRANYRPKQDNEIITLPIVIVGNETNTETIQQYMRENNFFLFNKQTIFFTTVQSLPVLDSEGKLCINFQYNYLRRPKGSACCLDEILHPQALQILKQLNIQYVHVVGSQNLNQSPGDPLFIGLSVTLRQKVSIKCTEPLNQSQDFDRLVNCKGKVKLTDIHTIEKSGRLDLLNSPIAMNSIFFNFSYLLQLVSKLNSNHQLSDIFRANAITQNTYNFKLKKPVLNQKCWTFQKEIKSILEVANQPLIVKVDRKHFIPIMTYKEQHSVEQAILLYNKYASLENIYLSSNTEQLKRQLITKSHKPTQLIQSRRTD